MARPEWRDRDKERFWRRVVRRWQRTDLCVREFCAAEGIGEASFYHWRRELVRRDQEASADVIPSFVPVHVRSEDDDAAAAAPAIEVVLANGRRLRVPAGFDSAMLRQLLVVAEEAPAC
jgi:hypothetical protein